MNYWIFVVTSQSDASQSYTARKIFDVRMQDRFWGLGENVRNRKNIQNGDQVVFYIGSPEQAFAGTARLLTMLER
jgi:hypothetical protein